MEFDKINFESYLEEVNRAIEEAVNQALEEASGELEAQVKRNTRVDTGQTKGSWTHTVDEKEHVAYVGSNLQNAIWEEFGTGIHAINGNGRKTPWVYTPDEGKTFYRTKGKKPSRALYKAHIRLKPKIEGYFKERFGKL